MYVSTPTDRNIRSRGIGIPVRLVKRFVRLIKEASRSCEKREKGKAVADANRYVVRVLEDIAPCIRM